MRPKLVPIHKCSSVANKVVAIADAALRRLTAEVFEGIAFSVAKNDGRGYQSKIGEMNDTEAPLNQSG